MLLALYAIDWGLIGLSLLSVLAVGLYFARQQRTVTDFAVAGRSLAGIVAGFSLAVTLLPAHWFVGVPGQAYEVGLKWWLAPIGICLAAPVVLPVVLPLLSKLEILSIYEYLEMRFGPAARWLAAGSWVIWRLVWLAVVVAIPCRVIAMACGGVPPAWVWISVVGIVATVTVCLGGLKAVVWSGLLQAVMMMLALAVLVGAVLWQLDDGAATVWQVTAKYDRSEVADLAFSWDANWGFFNALPYFFLLTLVMSVADQTVVQRLLATKNTKHCRRGYLVGTGLAALLLGGLTYLGLGLFAFYQEHPNALRPVWVVNLDNQTHQSLTVADRERFRSGLGDGESPGAGALWPAGKPLRPADANQPLVEWNVDLRDPATLDRLVADGRILQPNSKRPFADVSELLDRNTDQLVVDRMAMKKPDGELILHARAVEELLPQFVADKLGMGLLGLVVAGLLAASLASFDAGVHSLATVLLVDFHRRGGLGRGLLAVLLRKSADQLTESDELKVARPLTVVVGLLALVPAFLVGESSSAVGLLTSVTMIVGAPLLALFALGILTRRATSAGGCAGFLLGMLLTAWLVWGSTRAASGEPTLGWWPWGALANSWVLLGGLAGTFALGFLVSLVVGPRRTKQQLRGLVVGVGPLGKRELVMRAISLPSELPPIQITPPGGPPPMRVAPPREPPPIQFPIPVEPPPIEISRPREHPAPDRPKSEPDLPVRQPAPPEDEPFDEDPRWR